MSIKIEEKLILESVKQYNTPFYLYDSKGIIKAAKNLISAFSWNIGFKNYFAVKALPNPKILKILLDVGMGLDCSSLTELMLAQKVGAKSHNIMFTSNNTSPEEFILAKKLDAIINLDDISHIDFLEKVAGLPKLLCFRYNPGSIIKGNNIIGHPEEAKFGMTKKQIINSIKICKNKGVLEFGLHQMVISNNLEIKPALAIAKAIFTLANDIYKETGVKLKFINLGGGVGIPYKENQSTFDIKQFSNAIKTLIEKTIDYMPDIYMECGRYITGPYGNLISRVTHIKNTYKTYVGLDSSMHNLMRPALYGSYHQITVLKKDSNKTTEVYDLTGSLCENNDKFAINRILPKVIVGDIIVIHDVGAHGHAMGFNYNGQLRSSEILINKDNTLEMIRRPEMPEDYFKTLV